MKSNIPISEYIAIWKGSVWMPFDGMEKKMNGTFVVDGIGDADVALNYVGNPCELSNWVIRSEVHVQMVGGCV